MSVWKCRKLRYPVSLKIRIEIFGTELKKSSAVIDRQKRVWYNNSAFLIGVRKVAENRIAYGLAKKYGIDTTGMSPGEVWEALKKKGITPQNAYDSKSDRNTFPAPKKLILPKSEYAEVCSAVRTKYTNKIPANGQLLYGDNYYLFKYSKGQEKVEFTFKVKIEGNEDLINSYWGIIENE